MFTVSRNLKVIGVGVFAALAALPALAAEGRIPIPFTSPPTTPINITAPGKYILTRPIKATAAGAVINVAVGVGVGVSEVDIDLNGFTIDASPFAGAIGIRAAAFPGSTGELTIRNGAIQGGANGINAAGGGGVPFRKLVIENMRIGGTSSDAIAITDVQNIVVRNNIIVDAGVGAAGPAAAILMPVGGGTTKQVTIEGNLIRNTKDGINLTTAAVAPAAAAILNNRIEIINVGGTTGDAIHLENVSPCIVSENTLRDVTAGNSGIRLVSTNVCKLFDNVIDRASVSGIFLDTNSNDNLILRNVVRAAGASGLYIAGDRNQIESNLLNANGRGLTFDLPAGANSNVYRGNTARGNTGAAVCPAAVCSADFCGFAAAVNNTQGDNFLPALVAAPPVCEK